MHLELSNPQFSQFIDDQIKAGRFHSPEEALEEALSRMMAEEPNNQTLAAIEEAEAQLDRGEGRPWEQVRNELRSTYLGK